VRPSPEMLDDLRSTLHVLPRWQLDEEAWEVVRRSLRRLDEALRTEDGAGVRACLEEVESHGPVRRARIEQSWAEASRSGEPPEPVLELLNKIVHSLDLPRPDGASGDRTAGP
jgi:hypothetical protein